MISQFSFRNVCMCFKNIHIIDRSIPFERKVSFFKNFFRSFLVSKQTYFKVEKRFKMHGAMLMVLAR